MISLSTEHRKAAGIQGGEELEITVTLDLEPRTVEILEDLKGAMIAAGALEAFDNSDPSMRKEYVCQVNDAKTQETRER